MWHNSTVKHLAKPTQQGKQMEKTQQLFQQISHNAQVMGVTLLKSFTLATILSRKLID
jgi:hypothetical protein